MENNNRQGCRPVVKWFSEQMEAALKRNDHKSGWLNDDWDELHDRILDETKELYRECGKFSKDEEKIIREAADVANFAMMIADKFGKQFGQKPNNKIMREVKFRAWTGTQMDDSRSCISLSNFFEYAEDMGWPIMQYTGLKDKNGKELYEGDRIITRWPSITTGHIDELLITITDLFDFEIMKEISDCDEIEIIGNIYENPEFVNKK